LVTDRVVHVEVEFLATDKGGRQSAVRPTGYRPLLRFDGSELTFGLLELLFDSDRWVAPGERATGELRLGLPREVLATPQNGDRFEILEGSRVVGHGTVVNQ
jgi:translation elongation factor EF-Tu-like GTPase